jgi:hypothetical protein
MNLDRHRIYLKCPSCNFNARIFMRQVRNQDVLICSGCKTNIWLVDHLGQYRNAKRQVQKAIENLLSAFGGSKTITIKL